MFTKKEVSNNEELTLYFVCLIVGKLMCLIFPLVQVHILQLA